MTAELECTEGKTAEFVWILILDSSCLCHRARSFSPYIILMIPDIAVLFSNTPSFVLQILYNTKLLYNLSTLSNQTGEEYNNATELLVTDYRREDVSAGTVFAFKSR